MRGILYPMPRCVSSARDTPSGHTAPASDMESGSAPGPECRSPRRMQGAERALYELLAAWSLGDLQRVERATGGATHRVYRVESERGVAFLRVYKRPDRALVAREHALITRVRQHGIP